MKKITLFLILMIGSLGFSQVLPFNFSSPSHLMAGQEGTTTSIVSDAGNDVLQIVGGTALFDHAAVVLTQNVNLADDANNTITFRIKSNVAAQRSHLLKFEQGVGGPATTELAFTTTGTEWQNISLNFPAGLGNYAKIVLFTDFNNALTGTYTIDDFAGGTNVTAPVVVAPTVAAPTPTRLAANVISMFSNAYTNVPVDTWRTGWSAATLTDTQIAGNDTKRYSNLDFVGIETVATKINASTMTHIHLDIWTPNITLFRVKLVNIGTTTTEHEITNVPTLNGWNSLDIPLSSFTGLTSRTQLAQLIFSCLPIAQGTVFVDNVYFWKPDGTTPVLTQMSLPVTFDSTTVDYGLISFGGTVSTLVVDPTLSTNNVAKVVKPAGETWAGTTITNVAGQGFSPAIPFTATDRKMNVRVWSPTAGTTVRLKVEVSTDVNQSVETDAVTTVANGWQTLEFNFNNQATATAAFNAASAYNKASIFFNFNVAGSGQIYYFDDLNFGASLSLPAFVASNIKMYPNPTSSVFTIEANDTVESVSLFNVLGQEVLTNKFNANTVSLDISNLQTGVYVVKTIIGGVSSTSRIVKK